MADAGRRPTPSARRGPWRGEGRARRLRAGWAAAGLSVVVLGAACSDDGGGQAGSPGETVEVTTPTAPAPPPEPGSGTGTLVLDRSVLAFEVTECRLEPDPAEPESARALLVVEGAGTSGSGTPFTVEVQRFATRLNDVVTYTDTIAYTDSARILQAQRIEVGGQVTDLRDPGATSALLRPGPGGVTGAGLAGPPGGAADEGGIVGIALSATC